MTFAIIKSSDQCKNEKQKSKNKTVIKKQNMKSKMKIGKNSKNQNLPSPFLPINKAPISPIFHEEKQTK